MKNQTCRKGLAFVLTLAMVFTTLFGGFGFLGIKGAVGEVYAAGTTRTLALNLESTTTQNNAAEGWAWDSATKVLTLSGINLSTDSKQAVEVPENTTIVLIGENKIESTCVDSDGSDGIYSYSGGLSIIGGASDTLTVIGGASTNSNNSQGINMHAGDLTINGNVTAIGGKGHSSYGIAIYAGTLNILGGSVHAIGGQGYISHGIYGVSMSPYIGDIQISGGDLIAETIRKGSVDYGIRARHTTISGAGTKVRASGIDCGISSDEITIGTGAAVSFPATAGISGDGKFIAAEAGGSVKATSCAIGTYVPISIASVSISGQAKVGEKLSAAVSPSTAAVTYDWKSGGESVTGTGRTGSEYTVQASDYGKTITVTATGTGYYSGTVTSSPTSSVSCTSMSDASVTMTAPAAGATPQTAGNVETATANSDYTVSGVTWNQALTAGGKFKAGTTYTATVVLTSKNSKEFQQAAFTPTAASAASVGNTSTAGIGIGNTVTFTVTFSSTAASTVSSITVTAQPAKVTYSEPTDATLALNGMIVTATNNDGSTTAAVFTDGTAAGYTASPANGSALTVSGNNGHSVTITHTTSGRTAATSALTVSANTAKAITAFNFNSLTPNVTGTVNETAKTVALTVPYGTDVTALVPTITHTGASISPNTGVAQNFTSPVTYTVTAANSSTQAYVVTVTIAPNGGGGGGSHGGGTTTTPADTSDTPIRFNGQSENAGKTVTSTDGGQTVTTVTLDDAKIQEKMKTEDKGTVVSIPIGGSSDISQGVLNGQTIKDMEKKESVLEIKTGSATYSLPATEINIDSVSSQFGQSVKLEDIKISVKIEAPTADDAKVVADTANENNYQVVAKPVEFEITCTSGSKTVAVSKFNGYVERMIAIPDGIDPSRVTTGVVLNKDGTFSHIPTAIVEIDGIYYAKINSLTNSTYSVIYNPVAFADVAEHWAKASINNMGSRLVISGVGGNSFEPNRDITRAEFAAIMVRALGLAPDAAKNTFSDVSASSWYSGYVGTAASYGIISGYDADTFAPNAKITREQAMTMVARAMTITGLDAAGNGASSPLTGYTDTSKISSYANAGIIACLNTGVVTGKTADTIAPKNNITRAEVAVIIERLLKKSELI